MADHRTLSSDRRLVALCRHGAAKADEGHACCNAEFLVLFVVAYIFGIAFQYLPIRAMRRISRRDALVEAIKADTLALTAFEIGLFAWMAFIYFQFVPRSELTSPTYWFMMQIGMVLGFIASFPANWYLVRAGVKPGT